MIIPTAHEIENGYDTYPLYDVMFEIDKSECKVCLKETACLRSDSATGEYGTADICFDCISKAFNKFKQLGQDSNLGSTA